MTADDTNLWNYKNLMKRINIKVKRDLRYLANWLNSNKICLNVNKAEVFLFKSSRKFTDILFKLKRYGKSLYPTNSVKCLGIKTDENLNWKQQTSDIDIKLNKENAILSKLRHFVDRKTLRSIYHAIFELHLHYSWIFGPKFKFN